MEFEVTCEEEHARDTVQAAVLQNIVEMDGKIEQLKLDYKRYVRASVEKPDPEAGIFGKTVQVLSHKSDVPENGLVVGKYVTFVEENPENPFMFTSEIDENATSQPASSLKPPESWPIPVTRMAPVPSQALTEVDPLECSKCHQLKETLADFQAQISYLKRKNANLEASLKSCQDQLSQTKASLRRLQMQGNETSKEEWMHRFLSLMDSAHTSRYDSAVKWADKSTQCDANPVRAELEKLFEPAKTPIEVPKQSPSKSPRPIGHCCTDRKKPRREENEYLLRHQIIEKWANSFRSRSNSPLSKTFSGEFKQKKQEKVPKVDPVEERLRSRIVAIMKEKDVVRMVQPPSKRSDY